MSANIFSVYAIATLVSAALAFFGSKIYARILLFVMRRLPRPASTAVCFFFVYPLFAALFLSPGILALTASTPPGRAGVISVDFLASLVPLVVLFPAFYFGMRPQIPALREEGLFL